VKLVSSAEVSRVVERPSAPVRLAQCRCAPELPPDEECDGAGDEVCDGAGDE
jgi:hypothetical protein